MRRKNILQALAVLLTAIPTEALVIPPNGASALEARAPCDTCELGYEYGYVYPVDGKVHIDEHVHDHVDIKDGGAKFHENFHEHEHLDIHDGGLRVHENVNIHEHVHIHKKDTVPESPISSLEARTSDDYDNDDDDCNTCTIAPANIQNICYGVIRNKVGGDFDIHIDEHVNIKDGDDQFHKNFHFREKLKFYNDGRVKHKVHVNLHIDVRHVENGLKIKKEFRVHGHCEVDIDRYGRIKIDDHIKVKDEVRVHKKDTLPESSTPALDARAPCDTCEQGYGYGYGYVYPVDGKIHIDEHVHDHVDIKDGGAKIHENFHEHEHVDIHNGGLKVHEHVDVHENVHIHKN